VRLLRTSQRQVFIEKDLSLTYKPYPMKNLIVFIAILLFAARCFAQTDENILFKPDGTMFPFEKKGFHLKDSAI
jgi:hypothetical protein